MKNIITLLTITLFYIVKVSAQHDSALAASLIADELSKIQYSFEGEIIKAEIYAGDYDGSKLGSSDIIYSSQIGGYTYRQLADGSSPICYSIATVRVCQVYKGIGLTDTIKMVTTSRSVVFTISFTGADTSIKYFYGLNPSDSKNFFIRPDKVGLKSVFFAYNHTYSAISSQIKMPSLIGTIDLHSFNYIPNSTTNPYARIFAHSTGPLYFAHALFYSRQELWDSLENMPILNLNVHGSNTCLTPSSPNQKKNVGLNGRENNHEINLKDSLQLKIEKEVRLKQHNEWLQKSLKQYNIIKENRKKNVKRTSTTLTFTMERPRITGANSSPWLEFDIMVSSNSSSTYLDQCLIKFAYDNSTFNSAFGSNIVSNNNVQIIRAPAFNSSTYSDPQNNAADISNHVISIPLTINIATSPLNRVNVTNTPQKMLTIRVKIKTKLVDADLYYTDTVFTNYFANYTLSNNAPSSSVSLYDYAYYNGLNNDLTCKPIIDNFNDNVPAGIGEILTITGRYFGDSTGKDIRSVIFKNSNTDLPYPSSFLNRYGVDNYDIIYWTHDTIKVKIPGIIDSITTNGYDIDYQMTPGSGRFKVVNRYDCIGESLTRLNIPYAVTQTIETNPVRKVNGKIAGLNYKNGYTVFLNKGVDSMFPGSRKVIRRAMKDWSCITGISWELGKDTTLGQVVGDGVCVIGLSSNLKSTTLGVTEFDAIPCLNNNPKQYYLRSFDITLNNNIKTKWQLDTLGNNINKNYYDFYNVISHELGHAHLLLHAYKLADLMYWRTHDSGLVSIKRVYIDNSLDAQDGGQFVALNLKSATNCINGHTLYFPFNCSHTNSIVKLQRDLNNINIYPNPITSGFIYLKSAEEFKPDTYFTIIDIMGREVYRTYISLFENAEIKIPVDFLSKGIYLLQVSTSNTSQSIKFIKQ